MAARVPPGRRHERRDRSAKGVGHARPRFPGGAEGLAHAGSSPGAGRLAGGAGSAGPADLVAPDRAACRTDDDLRRISDFGLNTMTMSHKVRLQAALIDGGTAPDQRVAKLALAATDAFVAHVRADPRIAACDANPFGVAMSVRATLLRHLPPCTPPWRHSPDAPWRPGTAYSVATLPPDLHLSRLRERSLRAAERVRARAYNIRCKSTSARPKCPRRSGTPARRDRSAPPDSRPDSRTRRASGSRRCTSPRPPPRRTASPCRRLPARAALGLQGRACSMSWRAASSRVLASTRRKPTA